MLNDKARSEKKQKCRYFKEQKLLVVLPLVSFSSQKDMSLLLVHIFEKYSFFTMVFYCS